MGVSMKSYTIGGPAAGENFFNRPAIIDELWSALDSNSHLLIAAPRRVGKTSILLELRRRPKPGYGMLFVTTEAADSAAEYWKKLFNVLMTDENLGLFQKLSTSFAQSAISILKNIKSVGADGVEFGDGVTLDHAAAFERLIQKLNTDKKLVIMIDEFPQTVENISICEGKDSARKFLMANRALRQNPAIAGKVIFVYTGSIGLESVAAQLDGPKFINDLRRIKIGPFNLREAQIFIDELLNINQQTMDDAAKEYLLEKIEWHIPFYFQLIMQELSITGKSILSIQDIDIAINLALDQRNCFEHWHVRLKTALDTTSYKFAKEILNHISENMTIDSATIADRATKHGITNEKEILHTLVYDGYINNNDQPKCYRFNSPILRMWWNKNVAN
jgi:uncharacterized protein